jgi:hypothetical protein
VMPVSPHGGRKKADRNRASGHVARGRAAHRPGPSGGASHPSPACRTTVPHQRCHAGATEHRKAAVALAWRAWSGMCHVTPAALGLAARWTTSR